MTCTIFRLYLARMRLLEVRLIAAVLVAATVSPWGIPHAHAGPFAIQPTRLELDAARPSGALVIRNEHDAALSFQIKGVRWSQDETGQEHYADTTDLVYFPRLLTVLPGQSAVIRVGLRRPPGPLEKTYRIFIEELAPAAKSTAPHQAGARIQVLMRFGAPVFVRANKSEQQLAVEAFRLAEGQARWVVRNAGTGHEMFQGITLRALDASGAEVFKHESDDRYLLAGGTRRFDVSVPREACKQTARLALKIKTQHTEVLHDLEAGATPCH